MKFETITPTEFAKFATKSPYKSFMQTPEIAEYREQNSWTPYFLAVKDSADKILAATMLVAKPTFLGKSTFIAPGGPLLDLEDTKLTNFFFKHLKSYVKSHNGYTLHIDPYYELIERDRDGQPIEGGFNRTKAVQNLTKLGFHPTPGTGQPKYLFAMDIDGRTPDQIFADLKRNTRNHVRKAEKMGVQIRELKREELPLLKQITESTSKRRHFTDKPLSYYEKMYDLFATKGEAMFLLAEMREQSEDTISKHLRDSDSQNHNGHGRESCTEIQGRARLSRCDFDDRESSTLRNGTSDCSTPLSAAMFMLYGSEVIYLFSGSDERYMKEYNAQYLIQWHMIKYAAEHKFKRYNFYGISGLPHAGDLDGIYEFKKGFAPGASGHVVELIGSHELATNAPAYHLHRLLSKLKRH